MGSVWLVDGSNQLRQSHAVLTSHPSTSKLLRKTHYPGYAESPPQRLFIQRQRQIINWLQEDLLDAVMPATLGAMLGMVLISRDYCLSQIWRQPWSSSGWLVPWSLCQPLQQWYGYRCKDKEDETHWARNLVRSSAEWCTEGGELNEKTFWVEKEKQRLLQGESRVWWRAAGWMCPVSPKSFSDICCLCKNMQGILICNTSAIQHSGELDDSSPNCGAIISIQAVLAFDLGVFSFQSVVLHGFYMWCLTSPIR